MSGYTEKQYAIAFTVGNQTWVAITGSKRLVRILVYQVTIAFDDGEYLTPSLTIVFADASVKVYTTVTDIGTARTRVGYSQEVSFRSLGDGRNTVRNHFLVRSLEYFEWALFLIHYLLTLFSTAGECRHTERSNEQTGHFSHSQ